MIPPMPTITTDQGEFARIYRELEQGFHAVSHNDDAWPIETDPESVRRFADRLDQDAHRLTVIADQLRSLAG